MPIVPFTQRREPEIPEWAKPSDTQLAMAAHSLIMEAAIAHEQGVLGDFRNPDQPSALVEAGKYVRRRRTEEEDPTIPKSSEREIEPGERAVDRERGIESERVIRRY